MEKNSQFKHISEFNVALFKKRLKEITHGESNKSIAEKIGIGESELSKRFNGSTNWNVTDLIQLSKVYGCSLDYLFGITDTDNNRVSNSENLSEFESKLFEISEQENFFIDTGNSFGNDYVIHFGNPCIQKFLAEWSSILKAMGMVTGGSSIYETWKKGILENSIQRKKEYDYQTAKEIADEAILRLYDDYNTDNEKKSYTASFFSDAEVKALDELLSLDTSTKDSIEDILASFSTDKNYELFFSFPRNTITAREFLFTFSSFYIPFN
nr:helix-turn-helix transcriptional regulator [uncultured Butyrivibrio sp.]